MKSAKRRIIKDQRRLGFTKGRMRNSQKLRFQSEPMEEPVGFNFQNFEIEFECLISGMGFVEEEEEIKMVVLHVTFGGRRRRGGWDAPLCLGVKGEELKKTRERVQRERRGRGEMG